MKQRTVLGALWVVAATALFAHVVFFVVVLERHIRLHF